MQQDMDESGRRSVEKIDYQHLDSSSIISDLIGKTCMFPLIKQKIDFRLQDT